jgi:hypothetical protein
MKNRYFAFLFLAVLALVSFAEEDQPVAEESVQSEAVQEAPAKTPTPTPTVAAPTAPTPTAETEKLETVLPFAIGVQVGQTQTNVSESGFNEKNSISAGGVLELKILDGWFVQTELNYINKGYRAIGGVAGDEVSLKYLEVPLFLKAKYSWNNIVPSFLVGPYFSYLHSASSTTAGLTIDTTSTTERFEYGIYAGAGLDIALSLNLEIGGGIRYGWGLSDISSGIGNSIFNRTLHFLGGIKYRL